MNKFSLKKAKALQHEVTNVSKQANKLCILSDSIPNKVPITAGKSVYRRL